MKFVSFADLPDLEKYKKEKKFLTEMIRSMFDIIGMQLIIVCPFCHEICVTDKNILDFELSECPYCEKIMLFHPIHYGQGEVKA